MTVLSLTVQINSEKLHSNTLKVILKEHLSFNLLFLFCDAHPSSDPLNPKTDSFSLSQEE